MGTLRIDKTGSIVVSALSAGANFGKLLDRVSDERGSLVIEKRGTPNAVLLSIRDYGKLATPEPEVLRIIGEESKRNGTNYPHLPAGRSGNQGDQGAKEKALMLPLRLVIDTNVLVYVTPRGGDEVLAFDPGRLKTVPASALLEQVPTGASPVVLAIGAGVLSWQVGIALERRARDRT